MSKCGVVTVSRVRKKPLSRRKKRTWTKDMSERALRARGRSLPIVEDETRSEALKKKLAVIKRSNFKKKKNIR